MYNQILKVRPYVIMLKKMDFWFWCRYYIDMYKACPYNCSYCETNSVNTSVTRGIEIIPGLPEDRDTIGLGLLSDIYSPDEQKNQITTSLLEFLYEKNYPVNIVTKSEHLINDIDILKKFASKDMVRVTVTLITLDDNLSKKIEDPSLKPQKRLKLLKVLSDADIPAGIAISPVIPLVNDRKEDLVDLITSAKSSGAKWVIFSGFNPVSKFLNKDEWQHVKLLHKNQDQLKLRYRKTKQIILSTLFKENLPIRIPRINLYKNTYRYFIRRVTEYLYNISYLYELLENRLESMRYERASFEIEKIDYSLKSLIIQNKLGYIKGVNPEIEETIKEIISTDRSSLYYNLLNRVKREYQ